MDRAVAVVLRAPDEVLVIERRRSGRSYAVLPGGGVEPGEEPADAALRELEEETGAVGTVAQRLWTIDHGDRVAIYFLIEAAHVPLELGGPEVRRRSPQNEYRPAWIRPVEFADADLRPECLRELVTALITTPSRVHRVGDAAVRPRQRWSPAVHAALRHLRDAGFEEAPVPLGMDEHVERVSWIDGEAGAAGWVPAATDGGLAAAARLLRRLHAAGRGFRLPDETEWADRTAPRAGGVLCHGDAGPWNVAWRGSEAVGLIDWDFVHLGDPMDDVHDALETFAPFRDDETAMRWLGYRVPPDRASRITRFWRAYTGSTSTAPVEELVEGVVARQRSRRALVERLAAEGVQPQAAWVRDGHLDELDARIAWSETHRGLLTGA